MKPDVGEDFSSKKLPVEALLDMVSSEADPGGLNVTASASEASRLNNHNHTVSQHHANRYGGFAVT